MNIVSIITALQKPKFPSNNTWVTYRFTPHNINFF